MKKIIFIKVHPPYTVCPETEWAKREYRERWLVRQTKDLGYEAKLFLLSDAKEVWTHKDSVEVTFFPVDDKRVSKQAHTSIKMLERLNQEKPDLVVFKGLNYKLSKWIMDHVSFPIRVVFIVGGNCTDKYLDKSYYILAETEEQIKQSFSQYLDRVDILPKSLDLDLFKPNSNKKYDIVNVGSFEHRKNHKALLPLFKDYQIALIGDGPDWLKINELAKPYSNVYLPKNLSTEEVAKIVSQSKLMVHPSIWEGFPRVLIEAMSCGVPVVALSDTIKGIVDHNIHGKLVKEPELVKTVRELLDNPIEIDRMGKNCRELVEQKFSKQSTIPVLRRMFDQIL